MSEESPDLLEELGSKRASPEEENQPINPALLWYVWIVRLMPQFICGTIIGMTWIASRRIFLFPSLRANHVLLALLLFLGLVTLILGYVHERLVDSLTGREKKSSVWEDTLGAIVFCIMELICFPIVFIIFLIPMVLLSLR